MRMLVVVEMMWNNQSLLNLNYWQFQLDAVMCMRVWVGVCELYNQIRTFLVMSELNGCHELACARMHGTTLSSSRLVSFGRIVSAKGSKLLMYMRAKLCGQCAVFKADRPIYSKLITFAYN